jgi:UDP-N-acetylmuramyl pentapeptide synthase
MDLTTMLIFIVGNIKHEGDYYSFNIKTPTAKLMICTLRFPGIINIENFTAAIAVALMCGVN